MKILFSLFVILLTISAFGQETNQNCAVAYIFLNGEVVDGSNRTLSRKTKNRVTVEGTYYDSFQISCSGCLIQEKESYYLVTPSSPGRIAMITVSGVKGEKEYALFTSSYRIE